MYQFNELGAAAGGGTAALSFDAAAQRPAIARGFGRRSAEPRRPVGDLELVADLGTRIGSVQWYRGLVTCSLLCYAAYALAPSFSPIEGASPAPLSDSQWEEAQALAFSPLALGADTGRRMAPTEAVEPLMDAPERPSIDLTVTLGAGDGFARALQRAGVGDGEASQVAAMVSDLLDLREIRPGTSMMLTLGRRADKSLARPLDSLHFRARFDLALSIARVGGALTLRPIPIAVDDRPLRIQGHVGDSLYRSARAAGAPARAVEAYIRAVAAQGAIASLAADDRFDIILEHRRAETGETEIGRLLYAGLSRSSGKGLQLMPWNVGGRVQWFEASGVGRQSGTLQRPVPGSVSSSFGMRRHPILGYSRMHRGMDFSAGYGTPILAATDGRVIAAGWAGGYGRQVRLAHGGGLMTSYSHMSRIVAQPGSVVRQGQVIGYVGSTGLSTGPHLHYELYKDGVAVNPASVRFVMRSQLSGSDLEAFRARLRGLLALPVGAARRIDAAPAPTTKPPA